MAKPASPADQLDAEEIRDSESRFVEASVELFRKAVQNEYYRLRGYAIEGGGHSIALQVEVHFNFDPAARSVALSSKPMFIPTPLHNSVRLTSC